jgi:hypothetical protein
MTAMPLWTASVAATSARLRFLRIGVKSPTEMLIGLTDDVVRLLQSGTPVTHAGWMHDTNDLSCRSVIR